jgi:hypothetical protein
VGIGLQVCPCLSHVQRWIARDLQSRVQTLLRSSPVATCHDNTQVATERRANRGPHRERVVGGCGRYHQTELRAHFICWWSVPLSQCASSQHGCVSVQHARSTERCLRSRSGAEFQQLSGDNWPGLVAAPETGRHRPGCRVCTYLCTRKSAREKPAMQLRARVCGVVYDAVHMLDKLTPRVNSHRCRGRRRVDRYQFGTHSRTTRCVSNGCAQQGRSEMIMFPLQEFSFVSLLSSLRPLLLVSAAAASRCMSDNESLQANRR